MRVEAARCHDLARYMSTDVTCEMLKRLAKAFEREAERVERGNGAMLERLHRTSLPPGQLRSLDPSFDADQSRGIRPERQGGA